MNRPDRRIPVVGPTLLTVIFALWFCGPAHAQHTGPDDASDSTSVFPADYTSERLTGIVTRKSVAGSRYSFDRVRESPPPSPRIGVGGIAGRTSGLSVRVVLTDESMRSGPFEERAVDVNASFNLDGYLHVTAHVTAERPVENSPLTFFIGPGWLAGSDNGVAFFGASGNIGVYFTMQRYQIIMQLMPGIRLTPDVDGETGAAVGLLIQL